MQAAVALSKPHQEDAQKWRRAARGSGAGDIDAATEVAEARRERSATVDEDGRIKVLETIKQMGLQ